MPEGSAHADPTSTHARNSPGSGASTKRKARSSGSGSKKKAKKDQDRSKLIKDVKDNMSAIDMMEPKLDFLNAAKRIQGGMTSLTTATRELVDSYTDKYEASKFEAETLEYNYESRICLLRYHLRSVQAHVEVLRADKTKARNLARTVRNAGQDARHAAIQMFQQRFEAWWLGTLIESDARANAQAALQPIGSPSGTEQLLMSLLGDEPPIMERLSSPSTAHTQALFQRYLALSGRQDFFLSSDLDVSTLPDELVDLLENAIRSYDNVEEIMVSFKKFNEENGFSIRFDDLWPSQPGPAPDPSSQRGKRRAERAANLENQE
jgi:hypothetical protein